MPMSIRQFEPRRAVEVKEPQYGSGYRIGGRLILTAAHLLGNVGSACVVRAKRSFGEQSGLVVWKATGLDIALIELPEEIDEVEPIMLGQLPKSTTGEKLAFQMYAYPAWARTQREGDRFAAGGRQIEGTIFLEDGSPDQLLVVEPSRLSSEVVTTDQSQWAGSSGAAIICDGLVIAVQRQHQNPDRSASLEASPLWEVYGDEQWRQLLEKHGIDPEPAIARLPSTKMQLEIDWHEGRLQITTNHITRTEDVEYPTEQVYIPLGLVEHKKVKNESSPFKSRPQTFIAFDDNWVGRESLVNNLSQKIGHSCRLLILTGITGIGKTALGGCLAAQSEEFLGGSFYSFHQENFDRFQFEGDEEELNFCNVLDRWLRKWNFKTILEEDNLEKRLKFFVDHLCDRRYLIQVDSLEFALKVSPEDGRIEFVDEWWVKFFREYLQRGMCQSCIILTSQDFPKQISSAGSNYRNFWHREQVYGLDEQDQIKLFEKIGLNTDPTSQERAHLIRMGSAYGGHPLALRVIAAEIKDSPYRGNINNYWKDCRSEIEDIEDSMLKARQGLQDGSDDEWKLERITQKLKENVGERLNGAFDRLRRDSLAAYNLLCWISCSRTAVSERACKDYCREKLEKFHGENERGFALSLLIERCLVEQEYEEEKVIRIHNLIRSVAIDRRRTLQNYY
jgi:Trypsin-like peptidase domain